jgi:hypothetical protein
VKQFLASLVVRAAPFRFLSNCATTDGRGSRFFRLTGRPRPPVALLRNPRKTECGAKQFLASLVVRAAPFALFALLFRFSDFEVRLQKLPIRQLVNAELDGNFRSHVLQFTGSQSRNLSRKRDERRITGLGGRGA